MTSGIFVFRKAVVNDFGGEVYSCSTCLTSGFGLHKDNWKLQALIILSIQLYWFLLIIKKLMAGIIRLILV